MRKQESKRKTKKPEDLGKTKQKSKSELTDEELAKASGGDGGIEIESWSFGVSR